MIVRRTKKMFRDYPVSRRSVLVASGGVILASSVSTAEPAAARKSTTPRVIAREVSENGWTLEEIASPDGYIEERRVGGTGISIFVRIGEAENALLHVAREIHYRIREIQTDELFGWEPWKPSMGRSVYSNIASGTALQVRPGARVDAYDSNEVSTLRQILLDVGGLVAWGGDLPRRDESLFYLMGNGPHDVERKKKFDKWILASSSPRRSAGAKF